MRARDRSAIILIVLAVVMFVAYCGVNDYISSPKTWHSQTERDFNGELVLWRPPQGEGAAFLQSIFKGGAGTPAVLAMFGGQRYMIANIMWTYSDLLFHDGKPFQMAEALESTVTLNPAFTEAWSVYGWHLAWNLNTYTNDFAMKAQYLKFGEEVYKRAIAANPYKPRPYFDLGWLYLTRKGDYDSAMKTFEIVVNGTDKRTNKPLFEPMTGKERADKIKRGITFDPLELERKWDPGTIGHRLAYVYKKQGVWHKDWSYIQKAVAMYERCLELDPENKTTRENMERLQKNLYNEDWMAEQYADEMRYRTNFGMSGPDEPSPMEAYGTDKTHGKKDEEHGHSPDDGHDH